LKGYSEVDLIRKTELESAMKNTTKWKTEVNRLNQVIKEKKELLDIQAKTLQKNMIYETLSELDVLIICALHEEAEETLKVFQNSTKFSELMEKKLNGRIYWYFKLGNMNIIISWQSDMGTIETTKSIYWFLPYTTNLKVLIMCGICAGVEDQVSLGDVIVASDVFDYLSGSKIISNNNQMELNHNLKTYNLDDNLLVWSKHQESNQIWQNYIIHPKPNQSKTNLINGTIASGPLVRQDVPNLIKQLKPLKRKTFGIDMESVAIFQATSSVNNSFRKFVAKSVVDFGDDKKDDSFHIYSSQASAAFAMHLLLDYFEA